ncbi:MAG: GNAT family N-acetyltransferase [Candidatus Thermoplasmatota archaeon]|nr:GNAT family N-acetyltransferase [Candidatus Thermoplasmatota archaeon]
MKKHKFIARDGTSVIFREPRTSDSKLLMDFINTFVEEPMSGLLINKRVRLKEEKVWLGRWLADIRNRKGVMLLVEADGRIKGNCTVSRLVWKSSHMADAGIALSKDVRGKGIGEVLLRETIELARKRMRGLEMIQLKAFGYNERALELYKKLGFVVVGRIPRANKEGTDYYDDVLMVKYL